MFIKTLQEILAEERAQQFEDLRKSYEHAKTPENPDRVIEPFELHK